MPLPHLGGDFLLDLIHSGGLEGEFGQESFAEQEPDTVHAFSQLTDGAIYQPAGRGTGRGGGV